MTERKPPRPVINLLKLPAPPDGAPPPWSMDGELSDQDRANLQPASHFVMSLARCASNDQLQVMLVNTLWECLRRGATREDLLTFVDTAIQWQDEFNRTARGPAVPV